MATNPKTVPTVANVDAFLETVPDSTRRTDARTLLELMRSVTGEPPVMWGPSIIGFGSYHYRYASGRTGDAPLTSFSPRTTNLVVYINGGFDDGEPRLLEQLGPHKTGKGCLYLKRLSDVDLAVLRQLVERSMHVGRDVDRASRT